MIHTHSAFRGSHWSPCQVAVQRDCSWFSTSTAAALLRTSKLPYYEFYTSKQPKVISFAWSADSTKSWVQYRTVCSPQFILVLEGFEEPEAGTQKHIKKETKGCSLWYYCGEKGRSVPNMFWPGNQRFFRGRQIDILQDIYCSQDHAQRRDQWNGQSEIDICPSQIFAAGIFETIVQIYGLLCVERNNQSLGYTTIVTSRLTTKMVTIGFGTLDGCFSDLGW